MTFPRTPSVVSLTFAFAIALACGDADHPPPIGEGGRGQLPPIIGSFGGSAAGRSTGGSSLGGTSNVAGALNEGGVLNQGGAVVGTTFGGTSSFAGSTSTFGGSADSFGGTTPIGFGGTASSDTFGGTASINSFGGTFSTGGI